MIISDTDKKKYPNFHYYLKNNIPEIANNIHIAHSVEGIPSKIKSKVYNKGLVYGSNPLIKIVKNLKNKKGTSLYGRYTFGGNVIEIDQKLVEDFCKKEGLVQNKKGQKLYLLGATLLHELVHWADAQDGKNTVVPGNKGYEEGAEFEKAAYGAVLG